MRSSSHRKKFFSKAKKLILEEWRPNQETITGSGIQRWPKQEIVNWHPNQTAILFGDCTSHFTNLHSCIPGDVNYYQ